MAQIRRVENPKIKRSVMVNNTYTLSPNTFRDDMFSINNPLRQQIYLKRISWSFSGTYPGVGFSPYETALKYFGSIRFSPSASAFPDNVSAGAYVPKNGEIVITRTPVGCVEFDDLLLESSIFSTFVQNSDSALEWEGYLTVSVDLELR